MLDITFIREHPDIIKAAVKNKKSGVDVDELLRLDTERRQLQQHVDGLEQQRNELARSTQNGKPAPEVIEQGKKLRQQITDQQKHLEETITAYTALLEKIPNIPTEDTPIGSDETANTVLRQKGTPRQFSFEPKPHWQLGEELGLIDTERAGHVVGSRFAYITGPLVLLELALWQWVFSLLTSEKTLQKIITTNKLSVSATPFIPVLPPILIRPDVMNKMARLEPKEERYYIPSDDLYLIGSAEHTLGPLHLNETMNETDLPRRYVGLSPAFRREAGSYGKDMQGILRLHQFNKIEMESFSLSELSVAEQDFFVAIQEYLLQQLELPYQVVAICTGDMGGPDARQIDLETWLPGQNRYRETHTADLMTDYQARRLKTKVKRASGKTEYVHMNDATALAGRTLIAIMENYQQRDGSITMPAVLHPYLPFTSIPAA